MAGSATSAKALRPTRAEAQGTPVTFGDAATFVVLGGGVLLAAPTTVFIPADIVYSAQERLLPVGWAVPELITGLGYLTLACLAFGHFGSSEYDQDLALLGLAPAVLGSWWVAHSIWSLAVGDAPPPRALSSLVPVVQPRRDGVVVGLAGSL